MKPDLKSMTLQELRCYVLDHREDDAAFQALGERIRECSPSPVYGEVSLQEFTNFLAQQRSLLRNARFFLGGQK